MYGNNNIAPSIKVSRFDGLSMMKVRVLLLVDVLSVVLPHHVIHFTKTQRISGNEICHSSSSSIGSRGSGGHFLPNYIPAIDWTRNRSEFFCCSRRDCGTGALKWPPGALFRMIRANFQLDICACR